MKTCKGCAQSLPFSDFYLRNTGFYYTRCKTCYNLDKKKRDERRLRVVPEWVVCSRCKESKPRNLFHKNRSTATGLVSYCKKCAYVKNLGIKYKIFNIEELLEACGNACEICKQEFAKTPHVDHDHSCCSGDYTCGNCFRGLLCGHCNYMIGHAKDNPETLDLAARYLRSFKND